MFLFCFLRLEMYQHVGCFSDGATSVLPEILGVITSVQKCYNLALSKGYKVFALKFGQICLSGIQATVTTSTVNKRVRSCTNGMGNSSAIDLYKILEKGKKS